MKTTQMEKVEMKCADGIWQFFDHSRRNVISKKLKKTNKDQGKWIIWDNDVMQRLFDQDRVYIKRYVCLPRL